MRKLFLALFLLTAFCVAASYPIASAKAQNVVTLAENQITTGASANACYTYQADTMSIFFDTTGSSAVSIEIECYNGAAWFTLTGTGLPITTVGTGIRGITSYACTHLRTNVRTCTDCDVTTTCQKWKAN